MSTFQDFKHALANPPAERLAKIEYQSHFLQILGVLAVSGILIYKGYWYIIFAFIFSVGVSYSQGMTAYQRYHAIRSIMGNEVYDPEQDKSPSRKRDHIINLVGGVYPKYISIFIALILSYFIIGLSTWYQKLSFVFFALFFQIIIYFFLFYWISLALYVRKDVKGGKKK